MFNVYFGKINGEVLVLLSMLAVLFVQLLLCFRLKRRLFRLLPGMLLTAGIALLLCLSAGNEGWDGLGYMLLALFHGYLLLGCLLGWTSFGLYTFFRRRSARNGNEERR